MPFPVAVKELRAFNRFYTNLIGVVDRRILRSPYSLTEVRILYEIFHDPACTAGRLKQALRVNEGYLSHTVEKLAKLGLLTRRKSARDGRKLILALSPRGRREFLRLDAESDASIAGLIAHLSPDETDELLAMLERIRELFTRGGAPNDDAA